MTGLHALHVENPDSLSSSTAGNNPHVLSQEKATFPITAGYGSKTDKKQGKNIRKPSHVCHFLLVVSGSKEPSQKAGSNES